MKKYAAFILCAVFLAVAFPVGPGWCDEMQQAAGPTDQSQPPAYPIAPPAAQGPAAPPEQAQAPAAPPVQRQIEGAYAPERSAEPESTSVFFDIFILRPAGVLACAGGLIGTVVALPFMLIPNSEPTVVKTLVVEPFAYTFVRPIGKY